MKQRKGVTLSGPLGCYTTTLVNRNRNRPFPSSKKSHFQNEAKCEAIDMKMIFNYYANKTHFHNKGFALSLVLKVRFFGTRKWPIAFCHIQVLNLFFFSDEPVITHGLTLTSKVRFRDVVQVIRVRTT